MATILKIYFSPLLLNRKGQWTWNLVGSIGAICRSKIAKIVPVLNPRWLPWPPSWNHFFASSLEPKGQLTSNWEIKLVTCNSYFKFPLIKLWSFIVVYRPKSTNTPEASWLLLSAWLSIHMYKVQGTVMYIHAILVAVMSECSLKRVICKTWSGLIWM